MKTLQTTILTIVLILSGTIIAQADSNRKTKATINYALNKYVECMALGTFEELPSLLDKSFRQCVSYGERTMTYNKKQIVDYMRKMKNVIQNCNVSHSFVESNLNFSIAKVEMRYPTFTKIDYVTLSNSKNGWTITNIFTTYP